MGKQRALWVGALAQLFLIYLDFSGYCDIVIGVSRLMGIKIMENFNSPFISMNIQGHGDGFHDSIDLSSRTSPAVVFWISIIKVE